MATTKSRSYCLSNHISVLVDPSSVRNIKTPPFPSAHPHIPYLPFPSLSRLKRLGAGLVMFTVHADTSMKSEGGPGSAWTRRLWCLFTIYSWCTGLSHWIRAPVGDWKLRMNSTPTHQLFPTMMDSDAHKHEQESRAYLLLARMTACLLLP